MSDITHTIIATGCLLIAFTIGRLIGQKNHYLQGFDDGVHSGVNSAMQSLQHYGISIEYNVEIIEDPETEQ